MAVVRIENLLKSYGSVIALKHVSVEIPNGSLTAVLGPSGCGKTTLLRCISGLLMPDEGRIFIGDKDVTRLEPYRRNLGMVFQRPSMFPHMTVFQNIAWGLKLRKWPKADIASRVAEMLRLVHLEGMENRTYNQLSGGQAQRVVIARALAPQPDLLLLDEPLSALDAKLRAELLTQIGEIHRATGCTTILVTHDQAEALTAADNLILMNEGEIVQQGHPLDVYRSPQTVFSATFIGTTNLLPGTILEKGTDILVRLDDLEGVFHTTSSHPALEVGMPVWACIRADDLDIIEPASAHLGANIIIPVEVNHASLTGSIVIIEGQVNGQTLRIHVGGGRRLELLHAVGTTLYCSVSHVALVPRENAEGVLPTRSDMNQPVQVK